MKTAEEILADAAALVERRWCQCALERDGAYCASGAMRVADGARGDQWAIAAHTPSASHRKAWAALVQEVGGSVVYWNNAPERTAEEVATAMRNAKRFLEPA